MYVGVGSHIAALMSLREGRLTLQATVHVSSHSATLSVHQAGGVKTVTSGPRTPVVGLVAVDEAVISCAMLNALRRSKRAVVEVETPIIAQPGKAVL